MGYYFSGSLSVYGQSGSLNILRGVVTIPVFILKELIGSNLWHLIHKNSGQF